MARQPGRFLETLAAVVVGILVVRRLDVRGIDALGPVVLWGRVSLLAIPLMSGWFASWRAGRNGLDQWPNPHGCYTTNGFDFLGHRAVSAILPLGA